MLAKYNYCSGGYARQVLVDVELAEDVYRDDNNCTYSGDELEFINYDPFTQYNDMIFNTKKDFVHYIISCITDDNVDDITDEIIYNLDFDDIDLYNWLMSD